MTDEFAETDEWPTPEGWMRHQAETGLEPPRNATRTPADDRLVWRDRGARIAALEAENEKLRDGAGHVAQALIDQAATLRDVGARSALLAASRGIDALLAPSPAATTGEDYYHSRGDAWEREHGPVPVPVSTEACGFLGCERPAGHEWAPFNRMTQQDRS